MTILESTLMDTLTGRARGGTITGDIRFNNYVSDVQWRRSIGYVMQDDIFWEALTVHETLVCRLFPIQYIEKG